MWTRCRDGAGDGSGMAGIGPAGDGEGAGVMMSDER